MKKQAFGFTGKSDLLVKGSTRFGEWWYIFVAAAGSAIVSVSSSFTSSYKLPEKVVGFSGSADHIQLDFFFKCPWIYLAVGLLMMWYGARAAFFKVVVAFFMQLRLFVCRFALDSGQRYRYASSCVFFLTNVMDFSPLPERIPAHVWQGSLCRPPCGVALG